MAYIAHSHTRPGWGLALDDIKNKAAEITSPSVPGVLALVCATAMTAFGGIAALATVGDAATYAALGGIMMAPATIASAGLYGLKKLLGPSKKTEVGELASHFRLIMDSMTPQERLEAVNQIQNDPSFSGVKKLLGAEIERASTVPVSTPEPHIPSPAEAGTALSTLISAGETLPLPETSPIQAAQQIQAPPAPQEPLLDAATPHILEPQYETGPR